MIEIHRVEPEDLDWLREWRNNPELYINFNQYREIDKREQERWYEGLSKNFHPFVVWKGDTRIGYVALRNINDILRSAEFSLFIIPEYRHKGFGKEALRQIVEYGFEMLNLQVIYSIVFEFNKAIELYKKFGFKIDGLLRRTCYRKGRYFSSYYISMLKEEYENSGYFKPTLL